MDDIYAFAPLVEVEWVPRLVRRDKKAGPKSSFPDDPVWVKLRVLMMDTLKRFPDASEAVSDAIAGWEERVRGLDRRVE